MFESKLFIDAMVKHAVPRDKLTLNADRGGPPLVHALHALLGNADEGEDNGVDAGRSGRAQVEQSTAHIKR